MDEQREQWELRTYSDVWRIEKRLHRLYDFNLPAPVSTRTLWTSLAVFLVWIALLRLVGAPFTFGNGWHLVLWTVPPGLITVACIRPVAEGKRLPELALSYGRFVATMGVYARGRRVRLPGAVTVRARVWSLAGRTPAPATEPVARPALRRSGRIDATATAVVLPDTDGAPLPAAPPLVQRPTLVPMARPTAPERPTEPEPAPAPAPAAAVVAVPEEPAAPPEPTEMFEPADAEGFAVLVMACAGGSGQTTAVHALAQVLHTRHGGPVAVVDFATAPVDRPALSAAPAPASGEAGAAPVRLTLTLPSAVPLHAAQYTALLEPITARYPIVVIDPPTGTVTPLLPLVDHLVMTTTGDQQGDRAALMSTEWLRSAGHEDLCRRAALVVTPTGPGRTADAAPHPATLGVADVIAVPWDPALPATGRPEASRAAYAALAAHLAAPART